MSTYFAILTAVGEAKLANAIALGTTLNLTEMVVGDGNGVTPVPVRTQTALVHQVNRAPLNQVAKDPQNPSQIIAEQVLPETVGGWWIREIGLKDGDGDLVAVANCPPSYKPQMAEGSGRLQVIRMVLVVASTDAIQIKIDPAVVLATRKYADDAITTAMNAHLAAVDPHPQYLTANEGNTLITASMNAHLSASDPHPLYLTADEGSTMISAAVSALVNSSPATLDTLAELAAALGNDENFATTITNLLALKAPIDSPAFTGAPTVPTPAAAANDGKVANTQWVRTLCAGFLAASNVITPTNDATFANNSSSPASTSWVRGAMSAIATAAGFAKSYGTNGYLKLPSWLGGLIIQWGVAVVAPESGITVSLPITFPNAILCTLATIQTTAINGTGNYNAYATGTSNSTIIVSQDVSTTSGASNQSICWLVIGW